MCDSYLADSWNAVPSNPRAARRTKNGASADWAPPNKERVPRWVGAIALIAEDYLMLDSDLLERVQLSYAGVIDLTEEEDAAYTRYIDEQIEAMEALEPEYAAEAAYMMSQGDIQF